MLLGWSEVRREADPQRGPEALLGVRVERPEDAIELTSLFDLTGRSREEMIFDKEKLLSVYDMTKDAEPMKSRAMGASP